MIRKVLRSFRLTIPYARLAWTYMDDEDVWARAPIRRADALFGAGCSQDLSWYLSGESTVEVKTVAQVCRWLRGCTYVADDELFQRTDFWQHPRTFEQIRRGDCDDHALWAWRKLIELGLEPEFVVGDCRDGAHSDHGMHAWVIFDQDGKRTLLESVAKRREKILLPFRIYRDSYIPHFSFDAKLNVSMYAGFAQHMLTRDRKRGEADLTQE